MAETPANPIILDSFEKDHLKKLAALENKVAALYSELAKKVGVIGSLYGSKVDLDKVFKLSDYPDIAKKVDDLVAQLKDKLNYVIVDGVKAQWQLANEKNDDLVHKVFGEVLDSLPEEKLRKYFTTNDAALESFLKRKDKGLGLSQKVWKYAQESKVDIESALELGIKSGQSASSMARDLKQYLKEPNKLFRRVRDKEGELHLSKAAQAYHPGQGVYRSSYKNALRLAVTEANMAYRSADHERWQSFDFVVGIEIRLSNNHTLNGKPFYDICDELAGKYPKDFKFRGWHAFCRCYAISILKTQEELMADNKRILEGKEPLEDSVNSVNDLPPQFKKWVADNKSRILAADQRGTLPYFITDNAFSTNKLLGKPLDSVKVPLWYAHNKEVQDVQKQLKEIKQWSIEHPKSKKIVGLINNVDAAIANGDTIDTILAEFAVASKEYKGKLWEIEYNAKKKAEAIVKKPTALEIAKKRHEARTPEQIDSIKLAWGKRQIRIINEAIDSGLLPQEVFGSTGELYMLLKEKNYTAFNQKIAPLQKAAARHKARTPETIKAIKDAWNLRKEAILKDEQFLSTLIPDVKEWKKQFSSKKLHEVYDAIEKKMQQISALPLEQQVKALNKEILYVSDATYLKPHTLYSTWEVSQKAYYQQLSKVQYKISVSGVYDKLGPINEYLSQHPKVKKLAGLVNDVEDLINSGADISAINAKLDLVEKEYQNKLYDAAYAAKLKAKKGTAATSTSGGIVQFDESCFTKARKDAALWDTPEKAATGGYQHGKLVDDALYDGVSTAWKEAIKRETEAKAIILDYEKGVITKKQFEEKLKAKNLRVYAYTDKGTTVYMTERQAVYEYTHHYHDVNEPLEGRQYFNSQTKERFTAKVNAITDIIDSCEIPVDMWFQRGDDDLSAIFGRLNFAGVDIPQSVKSLAAKRGADFDMDALVDSLQQLVGETMQEGGFMSMGSGKRKGFTEDFGHKNVIMNIYAPKGTKAIYAEHFSEFGNGRCSSSWDGSRASTRFSQEFETIAQRGTKMRITKIENGSYNGKPIIYIDVEIIGQEAKALDYVLDSNIGN